MNQTTDAPSGSGSSPPSSRWRRASTAAIIAILVIHTVLA